VRPEILSLRQSRQRSVAAAGVPRLCRAGRPPVRGENDRRVPAAGKKWTPGVSVCEGRPLFRRALAVYAGSCPPKNRHSALSGPGQGAGPGRESAFAASRQSGRTDSGGRAGLARFHGRDGSGAAQGAERDSRRSRRAANLFRWKDADGRGRQSRRGNAGRNALSEPRSNDGEAPDRAGRSSKSDGSLEKGGGAFGMAGCVSDGIGRRVPIPRSPFFTGGEGGGAGRDRRGSPRIRRLRSGSPRRGAGVFQLRRHGEERPRPERNRPLSL